jgi:excisionase family DNA binding protein
VKAEFTTKTGGLVMRNFMTARELSEYLRLSESTVYKLALRSEIPGFKIGDSWRFDIDEVNKLIGKRTKLKEIKEENSEAYNTTP